MAPGRQCLLKGTSLPGNGEQERYKPGTFCWVDLATTDPASAKTFYGELFGWETEDTPAGEAGTYTMLSLEGDEVLGLYEMEAEGREGGHLASLVLLRLP